MNEKTITAIVSVLIGITGLAIIAMLVSPNAKTGSVTTSFGSAVSKALCVAMSPVFGGNCQTPSVTSRVTFGGTPVPPTDNPSVNSTVTYPGIP